MSYEAKMEKFDRAVTKAGLFPVYDRLNNIAEETLGTFLNEMIEDSVRKDTRPVCRIRYEQNDEGEWYIFEIRQADEEEYGLDTAFALTDDKLSYQALTKIRELMKFGYEIHFA